MPTVGETSRYIRSKNAGPFWITLDIFCSDQDDYLKIKNSPNMNKKVIGNLYEVDPEKVKIFFVDSIFVIKVSIPRKVPQGDKYERDMHGGQQYIELSELAL